MATSEITREILLQHKHLRPSKIARLLGWATPTIYEAINRHSLREVFGVKNRVEGKKLAARRAKTRRLNSNSYFTTHLITCMTEGCKQTFRKDISNDCKKIPRFLCENCKNRANDGHDLGDNYGPPLQTQHGRY